MNLYKLVLAIVLVIFSKESQSQALYRAENESVFDLIQRNSNFQLTENACKIINTKDLNIIFYLEDINAKKDSIIDSFSSSDFTILRAIIHENNYKYQKIIVDTVAMAHSCWGSPTLEVVFPYNVDDDAALEICVVLRQNPFCDVLIPYLQVIVYDNLGEMNQLKSLNVLPKFSFVYDELPLPSSGDLSNIIGEKLELLK